MKKLCFLLLCAIFYPLMAQNETITVAPFPDGEEAIVRFSTVLKHVTCIRRHSGGQSFIRKDNGFYLADTFSVPNELQIMDFRLLGEKIFFCGRLTGEEKGMVGYVEMGTGNYTYHYFKIDYSSEVFRMVVYESPNQLQQASVVAIGTSDGVLGRMSIVVHVENVDDTTLLSYNVRPVYNSADGYERLLDICMVDQTVVMVGFIKQSNYSGMVMHRTGLVNPFGPPMDDIFYYPAIPISEDVRMSPFGYSHSFLVSYFFWDSNSHPCTGIRTFSLLGMQNIYSQYYEKTLRGDIRDIIDIDADRSAVILENDIMARDSSYIIYLDPTATSSYYTPMLIDPDRSYQSITKENDPYFLAAGETLHWLYRDKLFSIEQEICLNVPHIKIFPMNNSVVGVIYDPRTIYTGGRRYIMRNEERLTMPLYVICSTNNK